MQEHSSRYNSDEQPAPSEPIFELTPDMKKNPTKPEVSSEEPILFLTPAMRKKIDPTPAIEQIKDRIMGIFAGFQNDGQPYKGSDGKREAAAAMLVEQSIDEPMMEDPFSSDSSQQAIHTDGFGVVDGPATAGIHPEKEEILKKPEPSFPSTLSSPAPQKAALVGMTQELASFPTPPNQEKGVISASEREALLQQGALERSSSPQESSITPKERPIQSREKKMAKMDTNAFIDALEHQTVRDQSGAEYRLEKLLGKGGMGFVMKAMEIKKAVLKKGEPAVPVTYKEIDPVTGVEVEKAVEIERAIKFILPDAADSDKAIKRFEREIRLSGMLTSPYIVKGLDRISVNVDGQELVGFVTEFVQGEDLFESLIEEVFIEGKARRQKKKMDPKLAVTYMGELMVALADLKSQGIIHRDLKPGNVILEDIGDGNKRVRLIDFGIAKVDKEELAEQHLAVQERVDQLTQAEKEAYQSTIEALPENLDEEREALVEPLTKDGLIFGTPSTMSPEQGRGKKLTHQSDIYSSGVIFYDLLTGKGPYKETQKPEHQIVAHIVQAPRSFAEVGAGTVPEELQDLVFDMLEKETSDRTVDSMEVYSDLKEWVAKNHPDMLNQEPWDFSYDHVPQEHYRKLAQEAKLASPDSSQDNQQLAA